MGVSDMLVAQLVHLTIMHDFDVRSGDPYLSECAVDFRRGTDHGGKYTVDSGDHGPGDIRAAVGLLNRSAHLIPLSVL